MPLRSVAPDGLLQFGKAAGVCVQFWLRLGVLYSWLEPPIERPSQASSSSSAAGSPPSPGPEQWVCLPGAPVGKISMRHSFEEWS